MEGEDIACAASHGGNLSSRTMTKNDCPNLPLPTMCLHTSPFPLAGAMAMDGII